jgi:hypothetical protein
MGKIIFKILIIAVVMFVQAKSGFGQDDGCSRFYRDAAALEEAVKAIGSSESRQIERNNTGIHRDASPEFKEQALESARREDINRRQTDEFFNNLGKGSNSSLNTNVSLGINSTSSSRDSYGSNGSYSHSGIYSLSNSYTHVTSKYEYNGKYYNSAAEREAAQKAEEERIRENIIKKYYIVATHTIKISQTSNNPYKKENLFYSNEVNIALYGNNKAIIDEYKNPYSVIKPIEINENDNNVKTYISKYISQKTLMNALSTTSEAVVTTGDILNASTTNEILSTANKIMPDNQLQNNVLNDFISIIPEMKEDLEKVSFSLDLALSLDNNEKQKQIKDYIFSKAKELINGILPAGETLETEIRMEKIGASYKDNIKEYFSEFKELLFKSMDDFNVDEWNNFLNKWFGKWNSFAKDGIISMSGAK